MAVEGRSQRAFVIVVFTVWLVTNISINLYNTYVLSKTHFKFPILLTGTNKLIGWLGSIAVMLIGPRFKPEAKAFPERAVIAQQITRPMVIIHGVLTAVNIGFNNWSLVTISLSLNQLIKSTTPLPTAFLSVVLEKKTFSWQVWASMAVVVLGTALAAIGNVSFAWGGALLCVISVFASAGWTVCSAILLQMGSDKMNAVDLVFYSSPWSILVTAFLFVVVELRRMIEWVTDPSGDTLAGGLFVAVLLGGGLLGFSYDLSARVAVARRARGRSASRCRVSECGRVGSKGSV